VARKPNQLSLPARFTRWTRLTVCSVTQLLWLVVTLSSAVMADNTPTLHVISDVTRLQQLTRLILNPDTPATSLKKEVVELTQILHQNGTFRFDASGNLYDGETYTNEGLALSPAMAAQCAADSTRTVVFIRGLYAAIQQARKSMPGRPIRVLYVGSGPYALLATPQMTMFSPEEVQFIVNDIHEPSIISAKSVVGRLGLDQSVTDFSILDALDYRIAPEHRPDVIVMEIMTAALESEPQVAITRHLIVQAPKAILVPEVITVDAYWINVAKEFAPAPAKPLSQSFPVSAPRNTQRLHLGTVFQLSKAAVASWKDAGDDRLPAMPIKLPDHLSPGHDAMLFTRIQTYGTNILNAYESGLTMPRTLPSTQSLDSTSFQAGGMLGFYYQLGSHPGLRIEALE
jgi:hypothetical protein